jgi:pimeloyl-ACP methyl ester carboxylesterase
LPESPEDQQIRWLLYTQNNPDNPDVVTLDNVGNPPPNFDRSRRTHFLVHGWNSAITSLRDTKDALLEKYDDNVFIVDWVTGASRAYYPQSASNTQVTGACSAYVAQELLGEDNLDQVHCTGHSLGGQTCGYMGFRLKGGDGSPRMARATGLDPAGPWFDVDDDSVRIDKTDAVFVDNIHTNGQALGIGKPVADVDFFPNKGERQPGCNTGSCDHSKCKDFFAASIRSYDPDSCTFKSCPCETKEDADAGNCDDCSAADEQHMGFYADTKAGRGVYYLKTVADAPYCDS